MKQLIMARRFRNKNRLFSVFPRVLFYSFAAISTRQGFVHKLVSIYCLRQTPNLGWNFILHDQLMT